VPNAFEIDASCHMVDCIYYHCFPSSAKDMKIWRNAWSWCVHV